LKAQSELDVSETKNRALMSFFFTETCEKRGNEKKKRMETL